MRASFSVLRISSMKVLVVISLFVACVAARGSGPYLPSGWRPDGPVFYLPSEVSNSLGKNIKEIIFSESEASGTDFLREYGPPKVQVASQDISRQGLPGLVNEQLFVETVVDTNTNNAKENSIALTEAIVQKLEANVEVKTEEALAVTESQSVAETESVANDEAISQVKFETTTSSNGIAAAEEFGYDVDPTVAILVPTEKINIITNDQSTSQVEGIEGAVVQSQQLNSLQQESAQLVSQVAESATQVTSGIQEETSVVSGQTELTGVKSSVQSTATQHADIKVDTISAVEEKLETVEEEVKKVEQVVQNIPELIVSLENEIKSQQTETIQEVPAVVKETLGSLEQIPEGFLEYGPPGFREYGPPKDETLEDNTKKISTIPQIIETNQLRRRRFSPKFRIIYKTN